jgi:hypothetical protein
MLKKDWCRHQASVLTTTLAETLHKSGVIQFMRSLNVFSFYFRADVTAVPF